MRATDYAGYRELPGVSYDEAVERVTAALGEQGFGILSEIDVKRAMKEKLDRDFRRYVILGACNPELAHRALDRNDNVGLLLPCNVVVSETADGAEVAYMKPHPQLAVAGDEELRPIADEAEERLSRAFEELGR